MAIKKKTAADGAGASASSHTDLYQQALDDFGAALAALTAGDTAKAKEEFARIAIDHFDEPPLADRARSYARICDQRMAPELAPPVTAEDRYYRSVMLVNEGDADGAIRLLDEALHAEPNSPSLLYVRASAWALKGQAESAVNDLRQAVTGDSQLRFQAANDPDFEYVREEPAFIDIIEPTPAGA